MKPLGCHRAFLTTVMTLNHASFLDLITSPQPKEVRLVKDFVDDSSHRQTGERLGLVCVWTAEMWQSIATLRRAAPRLLSLLQVPGF